MKLSAFVIASGLVTGLHAYKLTFYAGPNCRSANLGSYDSGFHTCGKPPANAASVIITNNIPENSKREVHFYHSSNPCGGPTIVARSGCVSPSSGGVRGWQTQHLGTGSKRDVLPIEFEA